MKSEFSETIIVGLSTKCPDPEDLATPSNVVQNSNSPKKFQSPADEAKIRFGGDLPTE